MTILSVSNLCFDYGLRPALKDVSFSITRGSTTALVGPNGSGKTTLLRCLTGLDSPIAGKIHVFGHDLSKDPRTVRGKMGYISDSFGLFSRLTVHQCLLYMAKAYGIPADQQKQRVAEVVSLLGLQHYEATLARNLSRGWRQRVGIGMAIIHKPELLLLDEPASGMDPDSRHALSVLLLALRDQGTTCIVSSHILAELEDYCTDMLVIKNGRVLDHVTLDGTTLHAPTAPAPSRVIALRVQDVNPAAYLAAIEQLDSVTSATMATESHDTILIRIAGGAEAQRALLSALLNNNIPVLDFHERKDTLQNQYIDLTRKHEAQI